MGYYIDVIPRNPKDLTLEELDRRFLAAGCRPTEGREDNTVPEDKKFWYQYQTYVPLGIMALFLDEETQTPIGQVRLSWGTHPEDFREDLEKFLQIAQQVGVIVQDGEDDDIQMENIQASVDRYSKANGFARNLLGGSLPERRKKLTWEEFCELYMSPPKKPKPE